MAESTILTGQYVRIEQTAASISDRIYAQLIDWCVMIAWWTMAGWGLGKMDLFNIATFIGFFLFPLVFYTLLCEIFNRGQSLGKMVLKTRVVKIDGSTPSLGAFLVRWLLYIIDGPMTSFMGLLCIMLTRNHQRLGDLAAGTVVIKLHNYKRIQVSLDEYDFLMKNYTPRYPQAADLSLEQIEIITRTLSAKREDFALRLVKLSKKVQEKLHVERAESTDAAFLRRIVRDYQYYALEEI